MERWPFAAALFSEIESFERVVNVLTQEDCTTQGLWSDIH